MLVLLVVASALLSLPEHHGRGFGVYGDIMDVSKGPTPTPWLQTVGNCLALIVWQYCSETQPALQSVYYYYTPEYNSKL